MKSSVGIFSLIQIHLDSPAVCAGPHQDIQVSVRQDRVVYFIGFLTSSPKVLGLSPNVCLQPTCIAFLEQVTKIKKIKECLLYSALDNTIRISIRAVLAWVVWHLGVMLSKTP